MKTPALFFLRLANPFAVLVVCFWVFPALGHAAGAPGSRERLLMDANWKFFLGNQWGTGQELQRAGSSRGPAGRDFNDSNWRTVILPHDWAIELPFDRTSDRNHGYKPVGPGFETNSVGWYRRAFTLPREDAGKRIWLEFDGAFRDSRVFVNGYFVGHQESGYSSFRYDVTDVANCGGKNVVSVRVDATEFEGWFYEGAGIYRHVWLVKTGPLAVAPEGSFVYATFKNNVPKGAAELHIETQVHNLQGRTNTTVRCQVMEASGKVVAQKQKRVELSAWAQTEITQTVTLASPALWSPESPTLYKLVTTIESGGTIADRTETEFGVRTTAWDSEKGFLLNGKPYVIKGMCNHHDHAGVGAALPDRLQNFRIARLKEMGCNAYRTSHNPPTPELLEACDRLGMLVMDESRLLGSDTMNLDRLERLVRRDRNHPSVFVWCIGNEEPKQTTSIGGQMGETMQRLIHRIDPTRLVTEAGNVGNVFEGINRIIDVRGWNYNLGKGMDDYHTKHPAQPNVGTEQSSSVGTRGIYATDKPRGYVYAYDETGFPWERVTETWWTFFAARTWISGGFVWTGFDYRGEPSPFNWPCVNSHFGVLDTCGFAKDDFYYYQAWWQDRPMIHLSPHWNWPGKEGQEISVRCFSNCEEVELFLNGQSLGKQAMQKNSDLRWKVKYAPGMLSAKGYKGGLITAEEKVETTGASIAVKLVPDRPNINADGEDVSVFTVVVVDDQGRVVPVAQNKISFTIEGPGRILGVGNGDPSCHEPDTYVTETSSQWSRSLFNGLVQVIVQSTREAGEFRLTASAVGLKAAVSIIQTQPCTPRPFVL
jgi:beta-galactosidase